LIDAADVPNSSPIAFVARNCPATIAALLGLIAAGRSIQMVYAFQSPTALARDIEKLGASAIVILQTDFSSEVRDAVARAGMAAIVLDGMVVSPAPGLERATRRVDEAPAVPRIEILTSGTTGPPKRFAISFDMILRHHMGNVTMAGARKPGETEGAPFLLYFPLGNISGIYSTLPTLLRGQPVTLLDHFSLAAWHAFVLRYRPVASGLPPAAFQMLLDADIPAADLASIKVMGTGAAPLDPTVQRMFEDRFGIPILLSYGATEFGGPVAAMTLDLARTYGRAKLGTIGRAMAGAQLRVVDAATGKPLAAGCEGLLEVVSPRIGPNWIRTTDIAVIDEDDFLFIRGRADGAIIRGGFKLVPEVIERALVLHPAIGAAAVVGVTDRRVGQVPAALIQPAAGSLRITVEAAEAHLRELLPATHIPVHWRITDDLPKNPSMKVDRPAILRMFEADCA